MKVHTAACRSLAIALIDDPFYQAVTIDTEHDPAQRLAVLTQYIALAVAEAEGIGEVHYANGDGGAIWVTDKLPRDEARQFSQTRTRELEALLGPAGFGNYQKICASMERNVPEELADAWYLSILGVHPDARGRGIAQQLLNLTLDHADTKGKISYLETFNPLSLPFYRRLGFVHEKACLEEITARPYWLLWREPQASAR